MQLRRVDDRVARDLSTIAPIGVIVGALAIDPGYAEALLPAERALIATAGDQRRSEFSTGRALLHRLLQTPVEILRTANGAPAWPTGTVGSLAHDRYQAVATVASARLYRAIGIDIEFNDDSDPELREVILRPDDPEMDPIAAFVCKEAAYKVWSSVGGQPVGPLEVQIAIDGNSFTAEMPTPSLTVQGKFIASGGRWLALATIPMRRPRETKLIA